MWQIPYALLLWAPIYGAPGFLVVYFLDAAVVFAVLGYYVLTVMAVS